MLFHKNTTKAVKIAMFVVGVLVIISMVIMYVPTPTNAPAVITNQNTATTTGTSTTQIIVNTEASTTPVINIASTTFSF